MRDNKILKDAIELVKYLREEETEEIEELEVNWLETTDEWVVNKGNVIIMDGLEENDAYRYQAILEGYNE